MRDTLPPPSPVALAHSARLVEHVRREIAAAGGWISFARYMELALYAPGLGYYAAGARKLGPEGDFTTAPELTPLFGHCIAQQARQILSLGFEDILEVGAGSGALAASLLEELDRLGAAPKRFLILELSADLRARSRDLLAAHVPHLMERIAWLNVLPPAFAGLVIGNEVLDAMPVHVVRAADRGIEEGGVVASRGQRPFDWSFRPASGTLHAATERLGLAPGYITEIGLAARAFVRSVSAILERGVMLFVDYGFPAREFYHPQRAQGTLMCHYQHRAHADPFWLPGLQDITAHVDFSAIAEAAVDEGLEVLGYTSQERFLVNCGITELMLRTPPEEAARYLPQAAAANKLLSPAEMGELFKAIALGRGVPEPLIGFGSGDRRHTL
ncbi:MAG: SAM-dependent methyltransferase [Betaproteobacteria bacterium]|nr:SAM-dependent methyltransferase [Betaproteobacteria bacterium]